MKRYLLAALLAALLTAPTAQGAIVRSELDTPSSGSCIGRDYTALGRAEWRSVPPAQLEAAGWELQYRVGSGGWTRFAAGSNQIVGGTQPIASFSTLAFAGDLIDLRLLVTVDETTGPPTEYPSVRTNVRLDKVMPAPPTDLELKAVSAHDALFAWNAGGAGPACGDPRLWTTVHSTPGTYESIQTTGRTALVSYLTGGAGFSQSYGFSAYAVNSVLTKTAESNRVTATTRSDNRTVLAGQVLKTGRPASLVLVSAFGSPGAPWTMTDAGGYYSLVLPNGNHQVRYETGCTMPAYCTPIQTVTFPKTGTGQGELLSGWHSQ